MASFESVPTPERAIQSAGLAGDPNQFGPSGQPRMSFDVAASIAWLVDDQYTTRATHFAARDTYQAKLDQLAEDSSFNGVSTIETSTPMNAASYSFLTRAIKHHGREGNKAGSRANHMLATGTPLTGRRKLAS